MKSRILLIRLFSVMFLSAFNMTFYAQTEVPGGDVYGIWLKSGSPYHINGDITIPNDSTLTIEHGVRVEFTGHYMLDVQGTILAEGLANDSIIFTVSDSTGYYNNTHTGWKGIRFVSTLSSNDSSKFVYCLLEYGKSVSTTGSNSDPERVGGALYIWGFSKILLYGIEVRYNMANSCGGGLYFVNQIPGQEVSLLYSNIHHNRLTGCCWGGGIYAQGDFNLIGSQVSDNSSGAGGGLFIESADNVFIGSSVISNNSAGGYGGGFNILDVDRALLDNNLICNNSAINKGGGLYLESSNTYFLNNTISNNMSTDLAGGIFSVVNASYSDTVMNTIVWGNVATNADSSITGDMVVNYSDIEGGFTGEGNINSNPLFTAPSVGAGVLFNGTAANWSLQESSPCINSGNPDLSYNETDLIGYPRVDCLSDTVDIGAYEFVPVDVSPIVEGATIHISENVSNNTIVHTVIGIRVNYFKILIGNSDNTFSLDSISGIIRIQNSQNLNHETTPFYEIVIRGHNNCAFSDNVITIFVDEAEGNSLDSKTGGNGVILFPNPVKDDISLSMSIVHSEYITVSVYSFAGQLIGQLYSGEMEPGDHKIVWHLNNPEQFKLPSSVYILHIQGGTFAKAMKFIIE